MTVWQTNSDLIRHQSYPDVPYFQKAYDFMLLWLSGQNEFFLQTSGSTGVPKTIEVNRQQLKGSAEMTGKALSIGKGTKALVCLNTAYVAGLMMLIRGMELGWELTIVEPSSNPLLSLDTELNFDFVAMVPMQLSVCLENEETKSRVDNLGKILLGGAPVNVALLRKISDLNVPVYQSYGMTETVSHIALRKLNGPSPEECYKVLPGVEWGIDVRGCLHVSGLMTNGKKIQTNDMVEIISETEFIWLGRIDNVINSGGVKIILDRVDTLIGEVFYDLNYINSFFTWFEEDEKLGQKLVLIVEGISGDLLLNRLFEEIRKRLSVYEIPKHVYFANRFIKTDTDKVDKRRTAQLLFQNIK